MEGICTTSGKHVFDKKRQRHYFYSVLFWITTPYFKQAHYKANKIHYSFSMCLNILNFISITLCYNGKVKRSYSTLVVEKSCTLFANTRTHSRNDHHFLLIKVTLDSMNGVKIVSSTLFNERKWLTLILSFHGQTRSLNSTVVQQLRLHDRNRVFLQDKCKSLQRLYAYQVWLGRVHECYRT